MLFYSEKLRRLLKKVYQISGFNAEHKTGVKYWKYRVRKLGKLSVVNSSHSLSEWEELMNFQKREIFPYLKSYLSSNDKIVLDLGCGPGRFTQDLAAITHGKAIGVDPVKSLLKMAPKSENVEYRLMRKGKIPLKDDSVDIVWVCLVLGGLNGITLNETKEEIRRVLRKGGLLCVIESTSLKTGNNHWVYRSVDDYKNVLSFAKLENVHDYYDSGDLISVMIGRME